MTALFEDDDEVTLSLLLSSSEEDCRERLASPQLIQRIVADVSPTNDAWATVVHDASTLFETSPSSIVEKRSTEEEEEPEIPRVFESKRGNDHISSLISLLSVSSRRAVSLTLGTLRSTGDEVTLLGTRQLFLQVVEYHYRQRTARWRLLAECLRVEKDSTVSSFLDSLGGLFRMFLITILSSTSLERSQMYPSYSLLHSTQEMSYSSHAKVLLLQHTTAMHAMRMEALEGLLVLLYQRMLVARTEFVLLILTFQRCHFINKRMEYLAALILAESLALWRCSEKDWIQNHPMFSDAEQEQFEMTRVGTLLLQPTKEKTMSTALLGFALLLRLSKNQEWNEMSITCFNMANDDYEVFAYLQQVLELLLPLSPCLQQEQTNVGTRVKPGDWSQYEQLLCGDGPPLLLDEGIVEEESAVLVAYASIGHEVLNATLLAFRQSFSEHNVGMLCNLAAQIYRNGTILCQQFWTEWEEYCALRVSEGSNVVAGDAVCYLLDAAYSLTSTALLNFWQKNEYQSIINYGDEEGLTGLLPSLVPLLRLVSSLIPSTFSRDVVREVLSTFLPENLIHLCVLGCVQLVTFRTDQEDAAIGIMESLQSLSRLCDNDCIHLLIVALEPTLIDNGSRTKPLPSAIAGPKLLYLIASRAVRESRLSERGRMVLSSCALTVLSELLKCHNADFVYQVGKCLEQNSNNSGGFAPFVRSGSDTVVLASMKLLHRMALNITFVAFEGIVLDERSISNYLNAIGNGALLACDFLTSTRTMINPQHIKMVCACLDSLALLLQSIQIILIHHSVESVKSTARTLRDRFLQALYTSTALGNSIAFYATLPVALGLSDAIQNFVQKQAFYSDVGDHREEDDEGESKKRYGEWTNFMRTAEEKKDEGQSLDSFCTDLLSAVQKIQFPEDDDMTLLFSVSDSAISLLLLWGDVVESAVLERYGNGSCFPEMVVSLSVLEKKELATDLMSFGPSSLLFRTCLPPTLRDGSPSRYWPAEGISNVHLLTRLLSAARDDDGNDSDCNDKNDNDNDDPVEFSSDLSMKAINLICLCLSHTGILMKGIDNGDNTIQSGCPITTKSFKEAVQIHRALLRYFTTCFEEGDDSGVTAVKNSLDTGLAMRIFHLLEICFVSHPDLAYTILTGQHTSTLAIGDTNDLIDKLVLILKSIASSTVSVTHALLASSCLDALAELWNACRHSGDTFAGKKDRFISHPCAELCFFIATKTDLISSCCSILIEHSWIVGQTKLDSEEDSDCQDETKQPKPGLKSALLNVVSKSLHILSIEVLLVVQEGEKSAGLSDDLIDFLEKSLQHNMVKEWTQSFTSYNGSSWSAQICSDALKRTQLKPWKLDPASMCHWHGTMIIVNDILPREKSVLGFLASAYRAVYFRDAQAALIRSWSTFAQVFCSYSLVNEADAAMNTAKLVIEGITKALFESAENAVIALSSSFNSRAKEQAATIACDLSDALVCALYQFRSLCSLMSSVQCHSFIGILDDLLCSSERFFAISQPSAQQRSTKVHFLGCRLRLRLLTSAFLVVSIIESAPSLPTKGSSGSSSEKKDNNRYNTVRVGFARLACDTLNLLRPSPTDNDHPTSWRVTESMPCYEYTFDSSRLESILQNGKISEHPKVPVKGSADGLPFELLCTSIAFLTALVPNVSATSLPYSLSAFNAALVLSLRTYNAVSLLLKHLDNASSVATASYLSCIDHDSDDVVRSSILIRHQNAVDLTRRIYDLFFSIASAGSICLGMSEVLLENHFIQVVIDNCLLVRACERWRAISMSAINSPRSKLRGYILLDHARTKQHALLPGSGSRQSSLMRSPDGGCKKDPVHYTWRTVIRTIVLLLRSCRIHAFEANASGALLAGTIQHKCFDSVVNFLFAYDGCLLSCLYECSSVNYDRTSLRPSFEGLEATGFMSSTSTTPSSAISFTPNALYEATDILSMLSELCAGSLRKHFESSTGTLYQNLLNACLRLTGTLSSFLGSIGTARELFAALSTLNKAMGEEELASRRTTTANGTANAVNDVLDMHPLLADGIPHARHEAIRNAHYASSCCICMTAADYTLSMSEPLPSEKTYDSSTSIEESFQDHVNNGFTVHVEHIAGQCLCNALSVIEKCHPAGSSFIDFNEDEVKHLDTSSLLQLGTIVALRDSSISSSRFNFFLPESEAMSLGLVENTQHFRDTSRNVRYARVLSFGSKGVFNVEYIGTQSSSSPSPVENGVHISRLAGMEDITKLQCVFTYDPAPKSVLDNDSTAAADISIGHLILALRWCHQQAQVFNKKDRSETRICTSYELVHCIAERTALLLGTEVSLHHVLENNSKATANEDVAKRINGQLLELFDDEGGMVQQRLDLSSPSQNTSVRVSRGLKSLIDKDVWTAVLHQMGESLDCARLDREMTRQTNTEQNSSGGVEGWWHTFCRSGPRSLNRT